ncbi:hypothetical protein MJO28_012342 [Puccinia striiformis f. sp. tritici]|uniref:Uncharacterized protein n=1 Tax=Puccinia striiformis f. sp. tritici TaxID=168172 RepID=A0ACC0E008_9BASI|nr:hypothetical protein MJO28_012342 [Puccinia striiformis f. sp. tritici]
MAGHSQDSKPTSTITNGTKDSTTTNGKLDPYQFIAKGSTHELRPDLGTLSSKSLISFLINLTRSLDLLSLEDNGVLNIRAVKVGLVHLKFDPTTTTFSTSTSTTSTTAINSGNDPGLIKNIISKKWKLFRVLWTNPQSILIKDVGLASDLQESIELAGDRNQANPEDQLVVRITGLEPDLVLSLDSGIALLDSFVSASFSFFFHFYSYLFDFLGGWGWGQGLST